MSRPRYRLVLLRGDVVFIEEYFTSERVARRVGAEQRASGADPRDRWMMLQRVELLDSWEVQGDRWKVHK